MPYLNGLFSRRLTILMFAAAITTSPCLMRAAQPREETTESDDETTRLAEFVVTGSNIPTAADAMDVPVIVLGSKDIAQTGMDSNLQDILKARTPALMLGRSNFGAATAAASTPQLATGGGSVANLRNLSTLVLVNGRRVAASGINALGGQNFVDISQFPIAAIDHIEILSDGASAIYGADAVGGVINLILKSNYQGAEIGARYAVSTEGGHYSERSGYIVAGGGTKRANLTVTGSWSKIDPIWQYQRPFVKNNPRLGTTLPGYVSGNVLSYALNSPSQTNPTGTSATAPNIAALVANGTYLAAGSSSIMPFNGALYATLSEGKTQKGATAMLNIDIVPQRLAFFSDIELSQTHGFTQGYNASLGNAMVSGTLISGQFAFAPIPNGSPYNPIKAAVSGVVMQSPATPSFFTFDGRTNRAAYGFRGQLNADWNWEAAGVYSDSKLDMQVHNVPFAPNLNASIAGGYDASGNPMAGGKYSRVVTIPSYLTGSPQYVIQPALDPFARNGRDPASLANVYGTQFFQLDSKLPSYDAKIVGTPFSLPGGKLGLAAGVNERKETLIARIDPNSQNLSTSPANHNWGNGAIFFDSWQKSRTVDAYYAELRAPVTGPNWSLPGLHVLDLSAAYRIEKYSDAGKARSPKLGLRWQPIDDQVTFRATYSKAFLAPDLNHQYSPTSVLVGATATLLTTNVLSPTGATNPAFNGLQYYSGNGSNPDLKPSYSTSRSFGIVLSPRAIKGLTIDVNYLNVFQKGIPAGIGSIAILQSVNTLGAASPFLRNVSIGNLPGLPGASTAALTAPYGLYNLLISGNYKGNLYILDNFINSGGLHETLTDINIQYELPTRTLGKFTFGTQGTYMRSFMFAMTPTDLFYEYAGYSTAAAKTGTFPHYAFYSTVDWNYKNWEVLVGNKYLSRLTDVQNGQFPAVYLATHPAVTVNYYTTIDLQLTYTLNKVAAGRMWNYLKGLSFTVGVNNLFDRFPPPAPLSWTLDQVLVDASTYSPVGRLFFFSGKLKF